MERPDLKAIAEDAWRFADSLNMDPEKAARANALAVESRTFDVEILPPRVRRVFWSVVQGITAAEPNPAIGIPAIRAAWLSAYLVSRVYEEEVVA